MMPRDGNGSALCVALAGILLSACSSAGGSGQGDGGCPPGEICAPNLQAQGADAGSLPQCVPGAWLSYGSPGPCDNGECARDAGPPECRAPDCAAQSFFVFSPQGTSFGSGYLFSVSLGTWSSPIAPDKEPYLIEDGGLFYPARMSPAPAFDSVTCSATQLVVDGYSVLVRPSPAIDAALQGLMQDGGIWIGLSYP